MPITVLILLITVIPCSPSGATLLKCSITFLDLAYAYMFISRHRPTSKYIYMFAEKKKAAMVNAVGTFFGGVLGSVVGGLIGSTLPVEPDTEDGEDGFNATMGSIVPVEKGTENSGHWGRWLN